MQIITRQAAKTAGLTHYFTGRPCKRGHIDKRLVSSCACVTCVRENVREAYRRLTPDQRSEAYRNKRAYLKAWFSDNRESRLQYFRQSTALYKALRPDYFKNYYAENKERRKRESQEWYQANAAYAGERQKAYAAKQRVENAEHYLATKRKHSNKRRAVKRDVFVEVVDPRVVFERDKGTCRICLKSIGTEKWEIDHIIPISRGGAHSYANVQLSHMTCNRQKAARLLNL